MKCFYHEDNDGKCAGAIVKFKYPECECFPINYGQDFPFKIINPHETIYIVDFSIEPKDMEWLLGITDEIHWIDHHKTAIEKYDNFNIPIKGIRRNGIAGCELTWQYVMGDKQIPGVVKLIGDRDVWKWEFGEETKHTHLGLGVLDLDPNKEEEWGALFASPQYLMRIQGYGEVIALYKEQSNKSYFNSFAYPASFQGYRCIAMNKGMCGSEAFGEATKDYDICISYGHFGSYFTVSLYSDKVDVSEIAKQYEYKGKTGGGHKGAAGFQCESLPFCPIDESSEF